jgi:hypothetical protein
VSKLPIVSRSKEVTLALMSDELRDNAISMLVSRRIKDMINDDRRLALKELFEGGANIRGYNNYKEEEIFSEVEQFYKEGAKAGNLTDEEKITFEEVLKIIAEKQSSSNVLNNIVGKVKGLFSK